MRIPERLLSGVVFLGVDEYSPFTPLGTGFLTVASTEGFLFQHVVTARHVIEGVRAKAICVRMNTREGKAEHVHPELTDWIFHPDPEVDLAICPTQIPAKTYDILMMNVDRELATPEIIADEGIGIGDDVFMAGMFTNRIGDVKNRPIVRTGTIAAMADRDDLVYTQRGHIEAHLIEARSIAGLSGSPVFVHMAPLRVMPDGAVRPSQKKVHYFLGVMQGHYITKDPKETISPDDEVPGDMSTGIGVVIPGERVNELMAVPSLKNRREEIVKEKKRQRDFVPGSAAEPEPPTTADDPSHREDFNRSLDEATRTRKRDD